MLGPDLGIVRRGAFELRCQRGEAVVLFPKRRIVAVPCANRVNEPVIEHLDVVLSLPQPLHLAGLLANGPP